MEKEFTEVLEEGLVNEVEVINHKPSVGMIVGIAVTAVTIPLIVFRKKIKAKAEERMIKKLRDRGYHVCVPVTEAEVDEVIENLESENE